MPVTAIFHKKPQQLSIQDNDPFFNRKWFKYFRKLNNAIFLLCSCGQTIIEAAIWCRPTKGVCLPFYIYPYGIFNKIGILPQIVWMLWFLVIVGSLLLQVLRTFHVFVFCFDRFTSSKSPGVMAAQKTYTDATATFLTFRWVTVSMCCLCSAS